ncbi:MAG: DUF4255 domain-containing protein [Sphingomicrobium sp.]
MAQTQAIAAVSATLAGLLKDNYPRDEFGQSLPFELYQPKNFDDPMKEGIGVCLWRVNPNGNRRNFPTRTDQFGRKFRGSVPIDLSYLIVPFAENAERQQRLLGWLIRAMHELGPIVPAHLNHYLSESEIFAEAENVDAAPDTLSVADYLTLWDRLKRLPPAVSYIVRLVLIDSDKRLDEYPLVEERNLDFGTVDA